MQAREPFMSNYCMNCMEPIGSKLKCEHCGSDMRSLPQFAHHLPAGSVLANGRYLVGRALGQGGFGITYIGRDLTLDIRVAIKEYYPAPYVNRNSASSLSVLAQSAEAQTRIDAGCRRFLDEARVLAKFHNSPGIVDVRDFFEENGTAYIVMDHLEGETLKSHLGHAKMNADLVFGLMEPILDALELVHAEQVIHRDISPDNIMICSNGNLCLMDFGAAHEVDYSDQRTVSMVLKSGYAPEEQYRARGELGPWTDIYALCATMYRAITGVSPDESLQRLMSDEMAWPSEMGISISPAQEQLLKKGMAPRRADRYQSIAEMKGDFASASASAAPVEPEQTPEPKRKHRGWAIGVIVAACVLAVFAAALYFLSPAYTVSFDIGDTGNDGDAEALKPIAVNRIGTIDEPDAPSRSGYAFGGWYLDSSLTDKATFPLKVDSDTKLYAAWDKTLAEYRVEYLDAVDGSQVADDKLVEAAEVGSTVTEAPIDVDGYKPASEQEATLVIAQADSENVIAFQYHKLVSYKVRYLDKGTGSKVSDPKTVKGNLEGAKITESAPEVSGYTLQSEAEQSIELTRNPKDNVIVFYYTPVPTAAKSDPIDYGGYSAVSGTSGRSSHSSKSNSDIKWAN